MVLHVLALFLGQQLHRQHGDRRGHPGDRRSVHPERARAADVADQPAQQVRGVLRRGRQVPRPRHAEPRGSRDRFRSVVLAGLSHQPGEVDVDGHEPSDARRRVLEQPRVLHERVSGRDQADSRHAGVVREHVTARERSRRPQDRGDGREHAEPGAVQPAVVGVVHHRLAQHQDRRSVSVGHFLSHRRCQRRPDANLPQQQHREAVHRARFGDGAQHAACAVRGTPQLRHRLLRAGLVDDEATHGERRHSLRDAEGAGRSGGLAGRPLRAGAALRRD